jgi:predicted ATPase/DNA-binding CsgD family transcriptional regulator
MVASLASRRTGNLPAEVTVFVGRRRELGEIRNLFHHARLVTLTGVGGVGKTRLAVRVAADAQRAFPDGVWLVELAGLREEGLVGQAVAAALGVREQDTGWSLATLSDLIQERQLLLVLDNCEHVLDACAVLVDTLLRECPGLRVLTTSRQPLRIAGEYCVEIEPLTTPDADGPASLASVSSSDAVRLFVERAAAVQPSFRLDGANASTVASICRRLDGIPLALELGAGRLRAMSVEQLLHRLESRYDVLIGGSRAALPRQQTMRALIDWSYALCTPAEQLLWSRLSMFVDGFSLECIEQVCSDEDIPVSHILDTLEGLVEKSIVSTSRTYGELRYRLPETLREYGAERLDESGESSVLRRQALAWYRRLVDRFQDDWFGPRQADLLNTLRLEHGNIGAALNFSLSDPAALTAGIEIAGGLRYWWTTSGRLSEGRHWLDRLLSQHTAPTRSRLVALCVNAYLIGARGASAEFVDRTFNEARTLARELGDPWGTAYIAQTRGLVFLLAGEPAPAAALLQTAADEHRRQGDLGLLAHDLALLASAMSTIGDPAVPAVLEECVWLCSTAGEAWIHAVALWVLGIERCKAGDLDGAAAAQRESLTLRIPLDARYLMALNLDALAWVAVDFGQPERAARLFGAAESIMREVGARLVSRGSTGPQHATYQSRARKALGDTAFARAYETGLEMSFDSAVAYALGTPTGTASTPRAASGAPTVLSQREFEVARLVARGLTNKQIAATLVISQRTAEGHVEHVLTKLGFTSRAQIAAWVTTEETTE